MPRKDLVQYRSGTASAWTAANPVLAKGEPGHESDTGNIKIGDGTSAWTTLPYVGSGTAPASPVSSVRKTADTTLNNNATLTADPHLTIPVASGGVYEVRALLNYSSSTTADLMLGWTGPATSTFDWTADGLISTATGTTGGVLRARASLTGTAGIGGAGAGAGSRVFAKPAGIFVAGGAGNLTLTWAQAVAEVSDTVLYAQSALILTRLA